MLFWLGFALAATAAAQPRETGPVFPEAPGQGPLLLHVGADGLGDRRVTLAVVAAAWGPADEVDRRKPGRTIGAGGVLRWRYPKLGLEFSVAPEHALERDPPVGTVVARAPFNGRTPNGLYLGMPAAEALAIIERDYQVRSRTALTWGPYSAERGSWLSVGARGGSAKSVASFKIRRDRLYEMDFRLAPEPWLRGKTVRELQALAVFAAIALVGHWAYRRWRTSLDRAWQRVRGLLGGALVLAGVWFTVAGVQLFGGGGWGALVGLVFGAGGVVAVLAGLVLVGQALRGARER